MAVWLCFLCFYSRMREKGFSIVSDHYAQHAICKAAQDGQKGKAMNFEKQIEFDKVKELWGDYAMTKSAKEQIAGAEVILVESELRKQIRDTTNSRKMIEKLGAPPLQDVEELKEVLAGSEKGECLTPWQLERVEKALTAVRRLKSYLDRGKLYGNPLAYYEENLDAVESLGEEISRQIRNEAVDDYASGELSQIRRKIAKCEEKMKEKAGQVMRSNQSCMADNFYTLRNGRVCVPVKKECRMKIQGSVVDKSATGNTLFMEPTAVGKYYEELQELGIQEENEVYRILYTLTAMVVDAVPKIQENIRMVEKLDYIFSKGKLSIGLHGAEPLINTERRVFLKDARHPLMDPAANVPLQFELGGEVRGIVVTGPNTGGKTVAIKTVMLNCVMAQCGLHPACQKADICMNNAYLCDIGDGQDLAENLSTFSAHIKNVLEILEDAGKDSFIIMDELGSGTDPAEGMGIAVAVLEELRESGANFLVTTHYPEVKEYARQAQGIINARMEFNKETLQPTYQMVIGEAGESCAFYIASHLGMPDRMLQTAAQAAYGEEAAYAYQYGEQGGLEKAGDAKPKKGAAPTCKKQGAKKIIKMKQAKYGESCQPKYQIGDSVMVYPDKKIGIVCTPANEKGVLRVQMQGKKIWINCKRVKLHVAAAELYPEDYDFSIIFETVEYRKARHEMERKYTEGAIQYEE